MLNDDNNNSGDEKWELISVEGEALESEVANTWVISVDFDGCTHTAQARSRLIQVIKNFSVQHPDVFELEVYIGSYRQSIVTDFHSAYVHNYERNRRSLWPDFDYFSSSILGKDFIDELYQELRGCPRVSFNPLLSSDIYNKLKPGTQFAAMQQAVATYQYRYWAGQLAVGGSVGVHEKNLHGEDVLLFEVREGKYGNTASKCCTEASKTLMTALQMHDKAIKLHQGYPGEKFIYTLFDDLDHEILQPLSDFLQAHPHLIPRNCWVQLSHFVASSRFEHDWERFPVIKGTGEIYSNLDSLAQDFQTMAGILQSLAMRNHGGKHNLSDVQTALKDCLYRSLTSAQILSDPREEASPSSVRMILSASTHNIRAAQIADWKQWSAELSRTIPPVKKLSGVKSMSSLNSTVDSNVLPSAHPDQMRVINS